MTTAYVFSLEMAIVDFHLHQLHQLDLSSELVYLFFEFLILLVEISGLFVDKADPVQAEGGIDTPSTNSIVPRIALALQDSIKLWSKDEHYGGGRGQLGAHEAEKVFHVRS